MTGADADFITSPRKHFEASESAEMIFVSFSPGEVQTTSRDFLVARMPAPSGTAT